MPLIKEQQLLSTLEKTPNLKAIRILTTSENFERRFDGSISFFFKKLKNSLSSIGGLSNREYFKGLSGCYFTLEESDNFEIIILYDSAVTNLNRIQVFARIKKLLGLNTKIELGDYFDYSDRIKQMVGIVRKTQTFGDFYFNKHKLAD